MAATTRTGFVWHEIYMWHDTSGYAGLFEANEHIQPYRHYEAPEAKRRIRNLLEVSGVLEQLVPIQAVQPTDADLLRVHTGAYLDKVKALDGKHGVLDGETKVALASVKIARLSAGGTMAAVAAVAEGRVQNAYALTRPPGHHATPDAGLGFCIFANAALAARHAQAAYGLNKVAIIDWDVHHGNGTEACFYDDPSVLTISLHQDNLFPQDSGRREDMGEGAGVGSNINIPLPAGSGDGAYCYAFERVVLPALQQFQPDLIIIACGFDSSIEDPLGRMMLHADSYATLTSMLMEAAHTLCDDRLVVIHEGGYNPMTTPYLGLSVVETLSGIRSGITDPALAAHKATAGQDLQALQREMVDAVVAQHAGLAHSLLTV